MTDTMTRRTGLADDDDGRDPSGRWLTPVPDHDPPDAEDPAPIEPTPAGDADRHGSEPGTAEPLTEAPRPSELVDDDEVDGTVYRMADGVVVDDDPNHRAPAVAEADDWSDRAVIPLWLQSREVFTATATDLGRRSARTAGFHLLRLPLYGLRLERRGWRSIGRWLAGLGQWRTDAADYAEAKAIMRQTGRGDVRELKAEHAATVKARTVELVIGVLVTLAVLGWVALTGRALVAAGIAAAVALVVGLFTSAEHGAIVERVRYQTNQRPPFTEGVLLEGLRACGAAGDDRKGRRPIQVLQPPTRIRTGWEAIVMLPVPAATVIKARETFSTTTGQPLSCVWLITDGEQSAGWLRVVITRKSMRTARMPAWPLLESGRVDWFEDAIPVGIDVMGDPVVTKKVARSTVYGGIMGAGKTVSMQIQVLGQLADPRVEAHIYDLKGGTDWLPFGPIAHFLRAGSDEADHLAVIDDLEKLNVRMDARFRSLRDLPPEWASPKTTTRLADRRDLDLHPIVIVIDETQELFDPVVVGKKRAARYLGLVSRLKKKGRAVGIIVELGTQEINKSTLPTAGLAQLRHCMSVQGHQAVDQVLGTGAYNAGYRPDELTADDAGIGYFGSGKQIRLCKSYYLDPESEDLFNVVERFRADRAALDRLTGMAAGDEPADDDHEGTFDRIMRVWNGDPDRLHLVELVDLLHRDQPDEYPTVDTDTIDGDDVRRAVTALSAQLIRHGVEPVQMRRRFHPKGGATSANRQGVRWSDVIAAADRRRPDLRGDDADDLWGDADHDAEGDAEAGPWGDDDDLDGAT